jgi:hypothetical protein
MLGKRLEPLTFFYEGVFMVRLYEKARGKRRCADDLSAAAYLFAAWYFMAHKVQKKTQKYSILAPKYKKTNRNFVEKDNYFENLDTP